MAWGIGWKGRHRQRPQTTLRCYVRGLEAAGWADRIFFTDWRGDSDEPGRVGGCDGWRHNA
ncbi:MAG TPA: hypothetical protein VJ820_14280 [Propionibacteriaceae bacterium]|nr:hypothetical protein [Propionibacteriaceae bacterium]